MTRKFFQEFIFVISLIQLILTGLHRPLWAGEKLNRVVKNTPAKFNFKNYQYRLIQSSDFQKIQEQSRLDQSLEIVDQMDDSQRKAALLNDLALSYARLGNGDKAMEILGQSLSIAQNLGDVKLKITTIANIAGSYAQIGQNSRAIEILNRAVETVNLIEDKSLRGELLLEISLKYGEIGQQETAQMLFSQSQTLIAEASQPLPEFPFAESPPRFQLGLSARLFSFDYTSLDVGINTNFYKQWPRDDIFIDSIMNFSYDSSRTINNPRPSLYTVSGYRHHFNTEWKFIASLFNSTNQDLFSDENDDEDLTIITAIYLGAALNLWQGEAGEDFLDLQLAVGTRYEYANINFEVRRNRTDPVLLLGLFGRGISFGKATLNQLFAITPAVDEFDNYIILSDTNLSLPLSRRWSLSNRMFFRYRNQVIFEENPSVEFLFFTGLEYEF